MTLPETGTCPGEFFFKECTKTQMGHIRVDMSHYCIYINNVLLAQGEGYVNGAGYCATYHWVVADAEEAHHLNVCRY